MSYSDSSIVNELGINASADIIEARLPVAEYIVKVAGSMIVDTFHHTLRSDDYIHALLKAIESLATKNILQSFPEDGILSSGGISRMDSRNGIEWVIDPIDGIHNFSRGIPEVGMQLAIKSRSELLYASMYHPFNQYQATATRNHGAIFQSYRNGLESALKVSSRSLGEAFIIYDGSIGSASAPHLTEAIRVLDKQIEGTRVYGLAIEDFTIVASGKAEAFITTVAHPEDVSPGILLVREAGGLVTDLNGNDPTINSNHLLVSNGVVHQQIIDLFRGIEL